MVYYIFIILLRMTRSNFSTKISGAPKLACAIRSINFMFLPSYYSNRCMSAFPIGRLKTKSNTNSVTTQIKVTN